jgi:hypothetical protein
MEINVYGVIYYVKLPCGKGYVGQTIQIPFEKRIKSHINDTKQNSNLCFHNALRKFIKEYGEEKVYDIVEVIDVAYSFEELNNLEIFYIEQLNTYYKNECGYNMTLGGEGSNGYIITDEHKEILRQRTKLLWESEEFKKKIKDAYTEDRKEILRNHMFNRWNNSEMRTIIINGISNSITEKWKDPIYYEKMINALHNRAKNIDYIENQRKKQKEVWETPGYRETKSQILKTAWEKPGLKEHQSEKQKEVWETPGYRENHSNKMKELFITNPDRRKESSEKMKEYWDKNPEKKIEMSLKKKAQFDKPGAREANSKSQLKRFENETTEDRRKRLEKYIKLFEVYDVKTNKKVGEWDLVSDFIKEKNFNKKANANIGLCLRGKCKSSNGFVFKYK